MPPHIAILLLDTAFPRIPGDVGNPASYDFPVRLVTVTGADVPDVVRPGSPPPALVAAFVRAAREAEAVGAIALLTSCGFLAHAQVELAAAVRIPVMASALLMGPAIRTMTGHRPLGILTADSRALDPALLEAAGLAPSEVAIAGMETAPAWHDLILATKTDQSREIDAHAIGTAAVSAARHLLEDYPGTGAILLECTNLPPYTDRIRATTGLPVFHILHGARLLWESRMISPQSPR